ncbi:MAG: agmatinase family protein [Bacteroidales bacterium]|jgi:agmatinase|nr:agmatinase family protein [Bacteroidales bacterium]
MDTNFDRDGIGMPNGNYFGLPHDMENARVVLLGVPWDATTSYRSGTSRGPESIMQASLQVDLFDECISDAWAVPVETIPVENSLVSLNSSIRPVAEKVISELGKGTDINSLEELTSAVNAASAKINDYVFSRSASLLQDGKIVGIIGGEHSVPYGGIKALSEKYSSFGILHIDAHGDLRPGYEGFTFSHASIMHNVLKNVEGVEIVCQVGVRDYCSYEAGVMKKDKRLKVFGDEYMREKIFYGANWNNICSRIIGTLPEKVYVSFDIDGLSPDLCPGTGTPVPGGLSFREADFLLKRLYESGRSIIGFDLCEVAPSGDGEWDANVGARMLFKLCLYAANSAKEG